jgi:hypothetical protein
MSGHLCLQIAIEIGIEIAIVIDIQSVPLIGVVDLTLSIPIPISIPISRAATSLCGPGACAAHLRQRVFGERGRSRHAGIEPAACREAD